MTRRVMAGSVPVGGGAPVSVQSMCNTRTSDVEATVSQILSLEALGCQIIRVAVPDMPAARAIAEIKPRIHIPLVADIHFDHLLALASVKAGADKIRINPGNIGSAERVRAVADACGAANVPIRIGVNGGSLEKRLLDKYSGATAEALVESALGQAGELEALGFFDLCVSIKASDVKTTVAACRLFRQSSDIPLHIGVTETGGEYMGVIKSAAGIGALLLDGVGDTLRVSLTAPPQEEVKAGIAILKAVGLRKDGVNIISCPTCGRTSIDIFSLVSQAEEALKDCRKELTVAIMGCAVNGPGEARAADFGIAGGDGKGVLFAKGKIVGTVPQDRLLPALLELIDGVN